MDYINFVTQWDPNAQVIRVYEAFHEGDYQTAMLRGRAILNSGGGNDGFYIALATSYFFKRIMLMHGGLFNTSGVLRMNGLM